MGGGDNVDKKKLLTCPPFGMGAYPPMGTPSPPYPPLYMSFCQFGGDNTLYNGFKNFGKNCSPTHKWGGGKSFYPYICIMEWIRKYREEKLRKRQEHDRHVRVLTEIIYLRKRDRVGGNMEIHFPKHDPPSQLDPKS